MTTPELSDVVGPDDLYSVPLEQFIAARDRLVDRLSSEGHAEQAASVAKLRKPSVAAWALNRAARHRPDAVGRLVESHRLIREATSAESLQDASAARRQAVAELEVIAATELTSEARPVSASIREKIATTLLAIANDREGEEHFVSGRLVKEIEASGGGWGEIGFVAKAAEDPGVRAKAALDKARARVEKLGREAASAERRVEAAERALEEAKRYAKERRAAAVRAEAELKETQADA